MPMRASDYINLIEHALGGAPDSRLDPLLVVNQALSYIFHLHDWKFRKRPPLNVTFQTASAPTAVPIFSIVRLAGVVTVTTTIPPYPPFLAGLNIDQPPVTNLALAFIVSNCLDSSFDGTFQLTSVTGSTIATWLQAGPDATSSGGTIGAYPLEQFITLPADFGELLGVTTLNNAIASIIPTNLEEIAWRRGTPNAVAYDGLYRCALSFPTQATADDSAPVPQLEIWPRPTASNPLGDLTLIYRAGPIPLIYHADDDSDATDTVPNFPAKFERLLTLISRLFAQGYEEELVQEDPLVQAEVAMLLESDGRQEYNIGMLKGGAVHKKTPYQIREFRVISDPANRTS